MKRESKPERRALPALLKIAVSVATAGAIAAAVVVSAQPHLAVPSSKVPVSKPQDEVRRTESNVQTRQFATAPATLDELLALSVKQLADVDIARINLLCATGLPGSEHLDVERALRTFDEWAERVHAETERHLYRLADPRYAEHYRSSEAYFRAELLVQVLYEDLGIRYDAKSVGNFSFSDSRVAFIHGMIPSPGQGVAETLGGTCASMPVMVTAVGRRLGYPLKLVTSNGHIFIRWEGEAEANPAWQERFNIEVTNGFSSFDDDYYKSWPVQVSDEEVRHNRYLVSLTPQEEFATFLAARGHCGEDNRQFAFAARCYENAYRYDTKRPAYRSWFFNAALQSDYRAVTPVLARALQQHRSRITALRHLGPAAPGLYQPPDVPAVTRVGPRQNQMSGATWQQGHPFRGNMKPSVQQDGLRNMPQMPREQLPDWATP